MIRHRRQFGAALTLALTLTVYEASAQEDETLECSLYQEAPPEQLLRRLSLDLRLRLPDVAEYEALDGEVSDAIVDEYLESEGFRQMVRRFHSDLLWINVIDARIDARNALLREENGVLFMDSQTRRQTFRGGQSMCRTGLGDEQTEFDALGRPIPDENGIEGWVEVHPYWLADPNATVRVCAFDAQAFDTSSAGTPCNSLSAGGDRECGCGPEMNFCWEYGPQYGSGEGLAKVLLGLNEQMLRIIDDHTVGGAPYSQMLTTTRTYQNGPIRHWKRYLAQMADLQQTFNFYMEGDAPLVDEPNYLDETWTAAERSPDWHSGILTLPAFTLRFQTNRARANRFRIAFMGEYFQPPADDDVVGCDPDDEDVTQRCPCRHCHQSLEPMAAYWSDISEAGSSLLNHPEYFIDYQPNCIGSQDIFCTRFYVTEPDAYRAGYRLSKQWADDPTPVHQQIKQNVDLTPAALAKQVVEDGTFARTTVENLFKTLMGRDPVLDPLNPDNEKEIVDELSAELQATDDFKLLVKRIVALPEYRRMR